jgi:hypothetical protein
MDAESDDRRRNVRSHADPTALWTAAVAAIISLALGEGRFGWFGTGVGLTLLFLLVAYYRPLDSTPESFVRSIAASLCFGGITGLLLAMILSWPLQEWFTPETPSECQNTRLFPTQRDINTCASWSAGVKVGWVWLAAGLLIALIHWMLIRWRLVKRQPEQPDG